MAVKPSCSVLPKLEGLLKCPVCLGLYTNPKTLPCLHSFCQECLKGLPQIREARRDTCYLTRPTCRVHREVPKEGVGAFSVAFYLNTLKEITLSLKKEASDLQQVLCDHHNKPLEIFCEMCKAVICHYCALRTHEGHKHVLVVDCKVKIFEVEKSLKEKTVSFSLSIEEPLVSVPVSSLRCSLVPVGKGDESIHTTFATTSTCPGVYSVHCNLSTSSTHTVKVQVYNVELEDTSLVIPFNFYFGNVTPVRIIAELNRPWGVAVSDDGHHYSN